MQKVVFIASLHRSGSTVLELTLQNLPNLIGIGEANAFMNNLEGAAERYCDCGKKVPDCEFWGPALERLEKVKGDRSKWYPELLTSFEQSFGKEHTPIDSSKSLPALMALQKVPDIELKVIFLIRDVRAWVTSHKKNSAGLKEHGATRYFLRWYKGNREIQTHLNETRLDHFQIGYEELILYPTLSLQRIASFLGVENFDNSLNLNKSNGHSIGGNRMRNDPKKRQQLYYDNRWFYNQKYWLMQMLLFPKIMRFNRDAVYANIDHPFRS